MKIVIHCPEYDWTSGLLCVPQRLNLYFVEGWLKSFPGDIIMLVEEEA